MRPRVVVAHEDETIRDAALAVVREAGYEGIGVADGVSARALSIATPPPAALVVDVGLPGVMAYQLVEEIRGLALPVRVVLVASVYSKTAYKRRPTSLYGADDYVEQHHIPDQLGPKLARLVPAPNPPPVRDVHDPKSWPGEDEIGKLRQAGEGRLAFRYGTHDEAVERARRLARLIVADVVLYNGAEVHESKPGGLAGDLAAARELFALRVPAEIAAVEDFVGQAVAEFLDGRGGAENPGAHAIVPAPGAKRTDK